MTRYTLGAECTTEMVGAMRGFYDRARDTHNHDIRRRFAHRKGVCAPQAAAKRTVVTRDSSIRKAKGCIQECSPCVYP